MTSTLELSHPDVSGLGRLNPVAPDALLALIALHAADPRPEKIDLGVGVFRDDDGATPVMCAVKAAELTLLQTQTSKSYLGAEGDARYTQLLAELVLGADLAASPRLTGVQTPGGTGALRLGAELLRRAMPHATVWIGEPTWPNHSPIFREAGFAVRSHRFYDVASASVDYRGMIEDLEGMAEGDILLLHGCCHNPSGAALNSEQSARIVTLCDERRVTAFVDLAYQGLGDGLDTDAAETRRLFEALPAALLAYSCDKNFGLYRDRVGALWVQAPEPDGVAALRGNMLALTRSLWSMPPDHGAAIVRTILETDALRKDWAAELETMRVRINSLRAEVAAREPTLSHLAAQRGMFAMLPVDAAAIAEMRVSHGIYMAGNGRINIAGLTRSNIPRFIAGLRPYL